MRSKILLEEKIIFVFQNDVIIVAGPDVQSGYLIRKKDITTPRSAYETCHAMKGMIRGKEGNEIHQAICMSVRNVLRLSLLLPVRMSDPGNLPLDLHGTMYLASHLGRSGLEI